MNLLRTESELVEAFRVRIRELGLTHATVDAISGLPDGYTSKLMGPNPMKGLGKKSIEMLCGALAMGFVAATDPAQAGRVSKRWVKRKRPFYAQEKAAASACRLSIDAEVPTISQVAEQLQAQLERREYMKTIGKRGGKMSAKRRMKTMGKRARQRAASHAARIRWSKGK